MTVAPSDAQLSEDGHYWWDEQNKQWQLIDQNATSGPAQTPDGSQGAATTARSPDQSSSQQSDQYTGSVEAQIGLYGACVNVDFADSEIDDLLARAGVSLEQT